VTIGSSRGDLLSIESVSFDGVRYPQGQIFFLFATIHRPALGFISLGATRLLPSCRTRNNLLLCPL